MENIENIILDFTGVVAYFNKARLFTRGMSLRDLKNLIHFCYDYLSNPEKKEKIKSSYDDLQRGEKTTEEICELIKTLDENYSEPLKKVFQNVDASMNVSDAMILMVDELKQKGYNVFMLTNSINETQAIIEDDLSEDRVLDHFDDIYFSHLEHKIKPDIDTYLDACNMWQIKPENTLFIDDKPINIDGANKAGLQTRLCKSISETVRFLSKMPDISQTQSNNENSQAGLNF